MATPASELLRSIPDVYKDVARHLEVTTGEAAVIEAARLSLVAHGLLPRNQALDALPSDHEWRSHEGSDATYFVEQIVGPNVVYVSSLPSHAETTRHAHHDRSHEHVVFESYVCVKGSAVIVLDNRQEREISAGQKFKVLPGVEHQVKTNGGPAILAIVLENGARYPREQRHLKR